VLVGLMVSPVLAAAQKVVLTPNGSETGSGFMLFNNPTSTDDGHNLMIEASLKGGVPGRGYYLYLFIDGTDEPPYVPGSSYVGSGTANAHGNVNIHVNYQISPGEHTVWAELTNEAGTVAYYRIPGWPWDTFTITFK